MAQFQFIFGKKLCLQILTFFSSKPVAFLFHVVNFWLLIFFNFQTSGDGTDFCFDASKEGHFLDSGVLKYVHARSGVDCILQCLLQDQSCRSVNFRKRPAANAEYENCELLYDVESESPELLHENDIYDYYILLQPNRTRIVSKSSCKELLDEDPTLKSGIYYLQPKSLRKKYPVYCHMTKISKCGNGGWTLVMKTDGSKQTFRYSSSMWNNRESYAVEDGLLGMPKKESKLASYWITPFTKICVGMDVYGDVKWMAVNYKASSLFDVIADGQYRETTAGRDKWKSLIAGSSLQPNCNKEGFGIVSNGAVEMRFGYMANNHDYCGQSDSVIGFGIYYAACKIRSDITCGNIAQCSNTDNGAKLTAAFGYILVQ